MRFNPPPGWPQPPAGWVPPPGWKPDPSWPPMPEGWDLWLHEGDAAPDQPAAAMSIPTPPIVPASLRCRPRQFREPYRRHSRLPDRTLRTPQSHRRSRGSAGSPSSDGDVIELNDQRVLQDVGIYRYHHPLEDAAAYKDRLAVINARIDDSVKTNRAVFGR